MANKITVLIDVVTNRAAKGIADFRQSIAEADGAVGKLKAGWTSASQTIQANAGAIAMIAGGFMVEFSRRSIRAASDLAESTNAMEVSYGAASDAVAKMGDNSVRSFGLSERAFNEAAVELSAFVKTLTAVNGRPTAEQLEILMKRAADFASVLDLETSEALRVFRSTLSGEIEPIKKYGINVSAAAVEQYALANGLVKTKSEMTEQIKVQARYLLLMEETAHMEDDWENNLDSLANQQKMMAGNLEDLAATFGQHLAPQVAKATERLNELLTVADKLKLIDLAFAVSDWSTGMPAFERGISMARAETDLFGRSVQNVSAEQMEFVRAAKAAGLSADQVNRALAQGITTWDEYTSSALAGGESLDLNAVAAAGFAVATEAATAAAEEHEEALKAQTDALNAEVKALEDSVKALEGKLDAQRAATDSGYATIQAEFDLHDAIADTAKVMTEGTEFTREHIEASLKLRDAAQKVADAKVREAEDIAKAEGRTLSATRAIDLQNRSLLENAATLNGPQQRALLDHIARINNIPESRMTEIRAAMDAGDIAAAEEALKGVSRTRSTAVRADRDQRSINETEAALNTLARDRTVTIRTNAAGVRVGGGSSSQSFAATGTHFAPGGLMGVGEFGPELVELPAGAKVHNGAQTRHILGAQGSRPPSVTNVISVSVDARGAIGLDAKALERTIFEAINRGASSGQRINPRAVAT